MAGHIRNPGGKNWHAVEEENPGIFGSMYKVILSIDDE
jgi:hypothetical protein